MQELASVLSLCVPRRLTKLCVWSCGVIIGLLGLPAAAQWYSDTQAAMGTRVHVEFYLEATANSSRDDAADL